MIRLLTELDRIQTLDYLYQEPNFNIFLIGDIENFGMQTDFQRVYGEFDSNKDLISVFLRYREHSIYYSHRTYFNLDYLEIFKNDMFDFISAKSSNLDLIQPHLPTHERKNMYFCEAKQIMVNCEYKKDRIKKLRTKEDCGKLYDLLSQISEFSVMKKSKEEFIKHHMQSINTGECYNIEINNKIVASAATTAETTKSAMVIGVATDKGYRNNGYASDLVLALLDTYINKKNKQLCLFYDNPKAGKIYMRLGFQPIGTWDMCEIEKS